MEAKELRIENYVMYNGVVYTVESILSSTYLVFLHTLDKEILMEVKVNKIDPVKLTAEWLEWLGFVRVGNHYEKNCFNIYKYKDGVEIELRNDEDDELFVIGMRCNCVHKLQNLYFAITGEELIIKK